MTSMTPISDAAFKRALRLGIEHAGLKLSYVAEVANVSLSTMAAWCDERIAGQMIPSSRLLRILPLLDRSFLGYLASSVGCVVSDVPEPATQVPAMAKVMKEFSEFCVLHCAAIEDGQWTAQEAHNVIFEAREVMALLSGLIESAQRAVTPLRAVGGGK